MFDQQFRNCFTFRVFRFSRCHVKSVERCPVHYIAQLICGSAVLNIHGKTVALSAGDYFYIPRGARYQSRWFPDETGQVAFYSFGFENLPLQHSDFCLQKISCADQEKELFKNLTENMEVSSLSVGYLYTFFGLAARHMERDPLSSRSALLDKVLDYMRSCEHASAADIAEHCSISESGLYTLFRQELGKTPLQVQHDLVIERAIELLTATDLSVEDISNQLGFSSSSYFRKIFKSVT